MIAMVFATLVMSLREIRRNGMRSLLTTLGVIIGVGAVIAMVHLGQGATARITEPRAKGIVAPVRRDQLSSAPLQSRPASAR